MELFNNDEDDQSQEVNGEINAKYDANYLPLTKWIKTIQNLKILEKFLKVCLLVLRKSKNKHYSIWIQSFVCSTRSYPKLNKKR